MSPATVEIDPRVQHCVHNCLDCYASCIRAASIAMEACRPELATHITLLQDCAGICRLHAEFLLRMSGRQARLASLCADFCRQCEEHCKEMGPDDRVMAECAQVCRRCADSCEAMARP